MSKQVVSETWKYMWRNKKNRLVMILCVGMVLVHSVLILPSMPATDEVDIDQLQREVSSNRQTFEDQLESGQTVSSLFTGTSAYQEARNTYVNQRELLSALNTGDARRYLEIGYRPVDDSSVLDPEGFNIAILGRGKEALYRPMKNQIYITQVDPLHFHHIHERTSLQQLHLFLIGWGPYLMIVLLLFMISDVVTKDRKLTTQKIGVSQNWFGYLFVQSAAALGFVTLFLAGLGMLFYTVNGIQYGFGSGSLPSGFFEVAAEGEPFHHSLMTTMPLSTFFTRALPFAVILLYGFTRLNTLFSLILKQDVVVLIASTFTLLFSLLYYGDETTELLGIELSWFPQTYFHFGDFVTGYTEGMMQVPVPYARGLIVLGVTILIIEGLIYMSTKVVTRQKFLA
ncbi:MAG: hypothetical protein JJU16_00975 [Alkalibacterium sp.]|nr:hypothetical protein [Alkalibacterium sp.]